MNGRKARQLRKAASFYGETTSMKELKRLYHAGKVRVFEFTGVSGRRLYGIHRKV